MQDQFPDILPQLIKLVLLPCQCFNEGTLRLQIADPAFMWYRPDTQQPATAALEEVLVCGQDSILATQMAAG